MADDPRGEEASQTRSRRKTGGASDAVRGKVRAHDPFELIRWLALSQPDPRKALAELVQNSLDAGAAQIRITRAREAGVPSLKVFDDGCGVIPDLPRAEALKFVATHIGHSRKRSLSPQERLELMTQGQYGIGLLGFWSLGNRLEMRSMVPGDRPYRLVLYRDKPRYLIEPLRGRLSLGERWTEVVVDDLHAESQAALAGRRISEFLAAELRGQLLARTVSVVVEDRMSRGRAQKVIEVCPRKFLGRRIEIEPVAVADRSSMRFEVYLSAGSNTEEPGGISIYSAGTLVARSFEELAALRLDRPPWTDRRFCGLVDCPGLCVAPGSRRGVVVDDVAGRFAKALKRVEPLLEQVLDAEDRRREEEIERSLIREFQRAFQNLHRYRPRYAKLPVGPASAADEQAVSTPAVADRRPSDCAFPPGQPTQSTLLPPGPLESVEISPSDIRVVIGSSRRLRVAGVDAAGRAVDDRVEFDWELTGPVGVLVRGDDEEDEAVLQAANEGGEGALIITARVGQRRATREFPVEVREDLNPGGGGKGIPEPLLVEALGESWRSRMVDGQWQVNTGHRDYMSVADRPSLKVRYLVLLFSKELVLQTNRGPQLERSLEQLVEVTAFADRNLARGTRRRP